MREPKPWLTTSARVLLDRAPWLQVTSQRVELPSGVVIDDYLLAAGRDYAMIVAVNHDDTVLLVRQYKHGLGRVITEFPAGYLDAHEEPIEAAKRELLEETGVTAAHWLPLGSFCLDSNRGMTSAHFFLARELTRERGAQLDSTEDLVAFAAPPNAVDDMLREGQLPSLACAAIWGIAMAAIRRDNGATHFDNQLDG